jgi:hypothetical protein
MTALAPQLDPLLFFGAGHPATKPHTGPYYGALAILGKYGYGPRPNQENNCLFINELDVIDPDTAARGLRDYLARGYSETACGPAVANGYHGQYPDTRWLEAGPVNYANVLKTRFAGLSRSLFALPDFAPWFDHGLYDWDRIEHQLTPFYSHPAVQGAVSRVISAWETYTSIAEMHKVFTWLARVFPTHERFWHNPPGHLSPGNSDENEEACWREAAPYLHGMMLQAGPPSGEGGDGRTPKEQMTYDLWDMQRRFHGIDSPWGPPVLGADGKPLRLYYREGVTYDLYWHATPEAVAQEWGAAAMTVPHVSGALDGFPVHSTP